MAPSQAGEPSAERLAAIDALFSRALDRPQSERARFVVGEAGDDLELRRAVEELLAATEDEGDTLEPGGALGEHLWDDLAERVEAGPALGPGERVGRYRVVEEIGRGGMSVVYLAERADGDFRQEVALKVLKRGIDTDEVLRRFAQERQILAALTHPGISRLLDGGVTLDARPYFVLERVEGLPIDRYCEEESLPLEERLRLVIQVGRALEHAHRKLVVHRDLKPSNILVDGDGQVKLLDFGIAKLVDPESWGATVPLTRTHMRLLTPEYASPEQVLGEAITTATDTYQLGLLLYELLTGRRPYRMAAGGRAELERAICEDEPAPPSTAVTHSDHLPAAIDGGRPRTRRRSLKRHLRGDLDNIVLKALRKQPERRYGAVRDLVEDLQRFLDGRPVLARGDTFTYRAGKFVRRHALLLSAAATVALLVVVLSVIYTVRLAEERDRARQQAARAQRVAQSLTEMFKVADPEVSGTEITARALLDRGLETIERELADEPQMRAEMQLKIGDLYDRLGLYDRAFEVVKPATEVLLGLLDEDDPKLAQAVSTLGHMLYRSGDLAGSRPYFERSIRGFERSDSGRRSREYFLTLNRLANLEKRLGNFAESRRLFEETLASQVEALGANHEDVGKTYNNFALTLDLIGDTRAARDALERSLEIRRRHHPGNDPLAGTTLENLAHMHRNLGDLEAAQKAADESLAMLRATVGELHPDVAGAYSTQGVLSLDRGDPEKAVEYLNLSVYLYQRTRGPEHFHLGWALVNLGDAYRALERWDDARRVYERALAIRLATFGPEHDQIGQVKGKLGLLAQATGDYEAAEELMREAVRIVSAAFDPPNPIVAERLLELGELLLERQRPAEAEPYLRQASTIFDAYENFQAPRARQALERCRTMAQ